jgi:glutamate-1-semialdehyde 2,1-aminomutase
LNRRPLRPNDLPSVAGLFERYPGQIATVVLEAETVEPPDPDFFNGLRCLCDRHEGFAHP